MIKKKKNFLQLLCTWLCYRRSLKYTIKGSLIVYDYCVSKVIASICVYEYDKTYLIKFLEMSEYVLRRPNENVDEQIKNTNERCASIKVAKVNRKILYYPNNEN